MLQSLPVHGLSSGLMWSAGLLHPPPSVKLARGPLTSWFDP